MDWTYEEKARNLISWHRKQMFSGDQHSEDCHRRAIRRLKASSGLSTVPASQAIRRYRGEVRIDLGWGACRYQTRYLYDTAFGTFKTKREAIASLKGSDAS